MNQKSSNKTSSNKPASAKSDSSKPDGWRSEVPAGVSLQLLQALHLLTRDEQLNADARRKLKQIQHFIQLLRPALQDVLQRYESPLIVDGGAGKSYLGFMLDAWILAEAERGQVVGIEARTELVETCRKLAKEVGSPRLSFVAGHIADAKLPSPPQMVLALHACDTATDDVIAMGLSQRADYIAVVPCCQAELAALWKAHPPASATLSALASHALHRRELGSHTTNVLRALTLEAAGYQVTVTELTGWEHSLKNELILAKKLQPSNGMAKKKLDVLLAELAVEPKLTKLVAGHKPSNVTPPESP